MRSSRVSVAALALCLAAGCTSSTTTANDRTANGPSANSPSGRATAPSSGTAEPASGGRTRTGSPTARSGAPTRPSSIVGDATPHTARGVFDAMTEKQRVGQLLMVDCPSSGVGSATVDAIRQDAVGSVILDGTTFEGMSAVRQVTAALENDNPSRAKLFVATDQEGGEVQRLQGPGYATIPSAIDQGGLGASTLQADATRWGAELRDSGVNVNLAPVLDTVPAGGGPNPPIGDLDREYGHTPSAVAAHGVAFLRGMAAAGVDGTVKHFPGLGRVSGNTDEKSGVTDDVTTADDPYLAPFAAAIRAGAPFVMMSTAIYSRIDPGVPAAFSHAIVTGLLRERLGFRGVVITDDVGSARQVADVPVGRRAVRFVQAGGDMVLTVDASDAGPMTAALLSKANSDASFRKLVDAAALRVLKAKQARGLLD